MDMELLDLEIEQITVQNRVRANLGDLTTLEQSIRRLGLLFPVLVDQNGMLVSGARRLQACRNLGMTTIPVLRAPIDVGALKLLEVQCDENLCRKPFTAQELEDEIERKKTFLQRQAAAIATEAPRSIISRFRALAKRLLNLGKE